MLLAPLSMFDSSHICITVTLAGAEGVSSQSVLLLVLGRVGAHVGVEGKAVGFPSQPCGSSETPPALGGTSHGSIQL